MTNALDLKSTGADNQRLLAPNYDSPSSAPSGPASWMPPRHAPGALNN
jgi:hypothetical protein